MECLCLGTIGQIVAPWKFDFLKLANVCFKNIKFPLDNYQVIATSFPGSLILPPEASEERPDPGNEVEVIVPRYKHPIVLKIEILRS